MIGQEPLRVSRLGIPEPYALLGIIPAGVMSIQRNDWSQMMQVVRSVDAE
jgi:hypothetical protein